MKTTTDAAPAENTQIPAKASQTASERFTNAVMAEFSSTVTDVELTNFQRKLCQSYFIKLDQTLKDNEKKRMAQTEQYRSALAYTWDNVNMQKLAIDTVCWSAIGLDPLQPNHINIILYKNSTATKFDVGFIPGYKGTEIKARKYGLDVPDDVVVELVFKTDIFKQFKKDRNNPVETYTFEVTDDFNRGEIVGGFYYHSYKDTPEKNKIKTYTRADIEKRRPDTASVEFWGGEKDEWVWDQSKNRNVKSGQKIKVEGWFEEMAWKTLYKAAYSVITIDSQKIDDNYVKVIQRQAELTENKVAQEVLANANKEAIGFEDAVVVEDDHADEASEPLPTETSFEPITESEMAQQSIGNNGPGY